MRRHLAHLSASARRTDGFTVIEFAVIVGLPLLLITGAVTAIVVWATTR